MSGLKITLEFDAEGGTTYEQLRRFVELTSTVPAYYPVTFELDPQSTEDRIVGISDSYRPRRKEE